MEQVDREKPPAGTDRVMPLKLWVYTNYDCNLRCSYCVARSSPTTPRKAIGLKTAAQLVDEAQALGFEWIYFTGGEPFLLEDIYEMLAYSAVRLPTMVLTNGMLLRGARLQKLEAIRSNNLVVQVSLDSARPEQHDAYRGAGSWQKTVEGIHALRDRGFRLRISTTETPANSGSLKEVCEFHQALGIPEEDHLVRLLARRGFSKEGIEVGRGSVEPEITINADGVYWHPLSTDQDLLVTRSIFPLAQAVRLVQAEYAEQAGPAEATVKSFK